MGSRVFASIVATAIAIVVACDDGAIARPCSNIPAGGCPIAHGVSCSDPTCEAVYACRANEVWEIVERCPGFAPGDAGPEAAPVAPDEAGPPSFDASIDAPPGASGGPGCGVLQAPDCPLGLVLACGTGCCGCEDLFVCRDGAWDLWGICGDAGPVPTP